MNALTIVVHSYECSDYADVAYHRLCVDRIYGCRHGHVWYIMLHVMIL